MTVSDKKTNKKNEMEASTLTNTEDMEHKVNGIDLNKIDINSRREEYLSWEDYFMATAFLAAQRSKDPSTQVGACIVNSEKRIVGVGYNGMPTGCSDEDLPWSRVGESYVQTKYAFGKILFTSFSDFTIFLDKVCLLYTSPSPRDRG